jgi:hypothetical protein
MGVSGWVATRRLCTTPRTFRAFRALCDAYSVGTAGDALRRVGQQLGVVDSAAVARGSPDVEASAV